MHESAGSIGTCIQAQVARKCGFYRQLEDHGTGKSRVRHMDVSIGGTEMKEIQARICCFWRHGYQH